MGDLVLKAAGHIQKGPNASKVPKWEGPYIIWEAYNSEYFSFLDQIRKDI